MPGLTVLPTYFINEVPNFIRIGRTGTILGHTQERGCHIVSSHFRSGIQAPVQLAQIKVLERIAEAWQQVKQKQLPVWGWVCFMKSQTVLEDKAKTTLPGIHEHVPKHIGNDSFQIESLLIQTKRKESPGGSHDPKLLCLTRVIVWQMLSPLLPTTADGSSLLSVNNGLCHVRGFRQQDIKGAASCNLHEATAQQTWTQAATKGLSAKLCLIS